jgi:hypothetical protein
MFQRGNNYQHIRVSNAVAAGVTTINATHVDMSGSESVVFAIHFGAIVSGAATSVKLQQGDLSDDSDMADITGATLTVADTDDNRIALLEAVQPKKRYVRVVVSRATQNATVDTISALLFSRRKVPVTQDTTVQGYKAVLSA